jgi:thioester reductase-like protein
MDSLMAMDIVRMVRSQFQVEFAVIELLKASSLHGITELLLQQIAPDSILPLVQEAEFSLEQEAVLDEAIVPPNLDVQEIRNIQNILLTGASGFLGAFLLNGMLQQRNTKIYCLVRASDGESGFKKIKNNLIKYGIFNEQYYSRIIPIIGDLAKPYFGLNKEKYEYLSQDVDVIYHSAAILNFVYPYSSLKAINVLGTQEVLRFACHKKVKPLHYISTDAVFDSSAYYDREVKELEPIVHTEGIDLGYTQTKWVSEKLVTIARERGLPVAIYRPPLITGDSRTGEWNTEDFTCLFLKGCIQMGCIPSIEAQVTFVPVDYVSQAIIALSRQESSLGKAFHLTNPHNTMWNDVAHWIDSLGHSLKIVPYSIWEEKLKEIAPKGKNVLSPLLPFFLKRWSDEQLTFAQLAQRRVKLNCQATVTPLNQSNIACHPVDIKLLKTYFSYFKNTGFI